MDLPTLYEPVTAATDYLLALVAWRAGAYLRAQQLVSQTRYYWSVAFFLIGAGAILGGTYHALYSSMPLFLSGFIWWATSCTLALTSLLILTATSYSFTQEGLYRRVWIGIASLKFVIFMGLMTVHESFIWLILDYMPALLLVGALHLIRGIYRRQWRELLISWGVVISLIGALVQSSDLSWGIYNHNDLYHFIQMASLYYLYQGVKTLTDKKLTDPDPLDFDPMDQDLSLEKSISGGFNSRVK